MKTLALFPLLLLAACQTTPEEMRPSRLVTTDQFEDVPAPKDAAYRFRKAESFSYRARTFRCGKFVYEYRGKVEEAVAFFRDLMQRAIYAWSLTGEDHTGAGSWTLTFLKDSDRCVIDVDRTAEGEGDEPDTIVIKVRLNYRR